ncbi:MAG: M20/M25/M40 family metallo-hydrolase [Armatimonadota bacterium]
MAPSLKQRCINELKTIGTFPTAPYSESRVARYIKSRLTSMDVAIHQDRFGNIIACYEGPGAPSSGGIGFAAHMDHPAIDILDQEHGMLLGSIRKEFFAKKVPILVYPTKAPDAGSPDPAIKGYIKSCKVSDNRKLMFNIKLEQDLAGTPSFGVWDMPAVEFRDNRAYMRAVDDVGGCALALLAMEEIASQKLPCRCFGIFSRSEETGFIGVTALVKETTIPKDVVIVSIETSKTLPDAVIGGGPVIRAGDTIMTFDGHAESLLLDARESFEDEDSEVKVQRQLMTGGGCEGTVYMLAGYPTTGLALPLGNYHNMGDGDTLAPEYIDLDDFSTGVRLLVRAASCNPGDYKARLTEKLFGRAEADHHRLLGNGY